MSTTMRSVVEHQLEDGSWEPLGLKVWDDQNYRLYGWLADVRNYSGVTPLSEPRGLPHRVSGEVSENSDWGCHGHSWYTVTELLAVEYNEEVEDRRCHIQITENYGRSDHTCEPGEGEKMKLSEFLGERYMKDLEALKALPGRVRVVFWFF